MKLLKISFSCKEKVTFLCRTHVVFRIFSVLKAGNSFKKYAKGSCQKEKFPHERGNFSNHENLEKQVIQ
jgi:hypothetical protein